MAEEPTLNDFIFGLAVSLLTSARGCIDEPKVYGPLRLVEALSALTTIFDYDIVEKDEFLLNAKNEIDNKLVPAVMQSEEDFTRMLDDLIRRFTIELKKRNQIE
ncbi:MAG TPA: DUF6092 family protein [Nitrososphaerales archaeon]|nr:DUF6092 family protein [Nitrososphaerales archaeon]